MTSQVLSSPSSPLKANAMMSSSFDLSSDPSRLKKFYPADQQVKLLHLQAEVEVLFQQLQTLKHKSLDN